MRYRGKLKKKESRRKSKREIRILTIRKEPDQEVIPEIKETTLIKELDQEVPTEISTETTGSIEEENKSLND